MPIYAFYCEKCEKRFESLSQPYEPVKCPTCGTYPAKRLIEWNGSYSIRGDNSASITPKRFRGDS